MKLLRTEFPYSTIQIFSCELGGKKIEFQSKPGVPDWQIVSPSTRLIAGNTPNLTGERILYLGCGHGAGVAAVAQGSPSSEIWCHDINHVALEMTQATINLNHAPNVKIFPGIQLPENEHETFGEVIIDLPKGRRLIKRWLVEAWQAAKPGGSLFIAGANRHGIQSALKDAQELWGRPTILGYQKGCRIARFMKSQSPSNLPAWSQEPGIKPGTWHDLVISFDHFQLKLVSLPGVFSYDHLDRGTKVLLEVLRIKPGARILDLGCGYGIIGIIACLSGASSVDLVDANLLCVAAAQENITRHKISNATVLPGDVTAPFSEQSYDMVITNPPFHAGQIVDYQIAEAFIEQSYHHLNPGGELVMVANQFIPYEQTIRKYFRQIRQLCDHEGYQVWSAIK